MRIVSTAQGSATLEGSSDVVEQGETESRSTGCVPSGASEEDGPETWEALLFPGRKRLKGSRTQISCGRPVKVRARDARLRKKPSRPG